MSSTTRPMLTVETDDATAAAVAPTPPPTPRRAQRPSPTPPDNQLSNRALALVLMGFILSVLDFFIVNVALPTMGRDLHASVTSLELVVSGYGITYALLLVLGGRLGDAVGRRRLFLGGMAAFTLTSLMCGVAPTATVLIAARALQGSAAAFMVPQVLATIQATTAGPARARAVGFYSAAAGLAMVAGQLLGGAIVSADIAGTGWRGIFLVNVPIGAVVFTLARRAVPENRSDNPAPIDAVGTLLLATTLVCLLVPLTVGKALGWPWWSWVMLALAPVSGWYFARFELALQAQGRTPLVPPAILARASMRTGLSVAMPFFVSFGGFMFIYAVATQEGLGLSPLAAGATLAPFAGAFLLASLATARAVARFGIAVTTLGTAVQALGLATLAALVLTGWPHHNLAACLVVLTVTGFAQGIVVSPLFRVILSDVPPRLAGAGAGTLTTTQQLSLALGVAVLGGLYTALASSLGYRQAGGIILTLQAIIAAGTAVRSRRLPPLA